VRNRRDFKVCARRGEQIELFAMIAAYLDESGTASRDSVLTVAITVGNSEAWAEFESQWRPKINHLKDGYHARRHKKLYPDLADLMISHTEFSAFLTLSEKDYHKHFPKWVQSVQGGPYSFAVLFNITVASQWAKNHNSGPIMYYIEHGHPGFTHATMMMTAIMRNRDLREFYSMHNWGPATKQDLPVHCPDTVSHCAHRGQNGNGYGVFLKKLLNRDKLIPGRVMETVFQENSSRFKEAISMGLREAKNALKYQREIERLKP